VPVYRARAGTWRYLLYAAAHITHRCFRTGLAPSCETLHCACCCYIATVLPAAFALLQTDGFSYRTLRAYQVPGEGLYLGAGQYLLPCLVLLLPGTFRAAVPVPLPFFSPSTAGGGVWAVQLFFSPLQTGGSSRCGGSPRCVPGRDVPLHFISISRARAGLRLLGVLCSALRATPHHLGAVPLLALHTLAVTCLYVSGRALISNSPLYRGRYHLFTGALARGRRPQAGRRISYALFMISVDLPVPHRLVPAICFCVLFAIWFFGCDGLL